MSVIVCLGAGVEGLPILARAKALGCRLVVVDGNPQAPGFALADVAVVASCYDAAATVDAINLGYHPDGVLCCAVDAPNVAAWVAQEFDLPGLTPTQAALSCDKFLQKRALHAAGVPVPQFSEIALTSVKNVVVIDNSAKSDWPLDISGLVLKPIDNRGARGVRLFKTPGTIFDSDVRGARDASPSGRTMVERYLTGPQFSTESLVQDGRILWTGIALRNYDRLEEYAPHIIEDGYDAPNGEDDFRDQIEILLERACRALDWYQTGGGVVKGDLVLHDGDLYIIELAARLSGGFLSTHGWPLAYGMPFVDYAIQAALGKPLYVTHGGMRQQYVSQLYVFPKPEWIGRKVKDTEGAGTFSIETAFYPVGCEFSTIAIHEGDTIRPVTDHAARLGQATTVGSTPEQARARASAAVAAMRDGIAAE